MAAISDYLESGLLHHIFRGETFSKPAQMAIALTSTVPIDSDTGATIAEIPSGINGSGTGYARIMLGVPANSGNAKWTYAAADNAVGSGVIRNADNLVFDTALLDWGWVSGIAVVDTNNHASGNVLMHGQLTNPRSIFLGDSMKFDMSTLEINFK